MTDKLDNAMKATEYLNRLIEDGTILSATDAARRTGYSRQGITRLIRDGRVNNLSVGRALFVWADEIDRWVAKNGDCNA